ncbi:unnamed protein product [Caenorhabditis nigoni]
MNWSHHLEVVEISYMFRGNGYKTVCGENRNFIESVDYMEGFRNDYNLIMKFQKSSLKRFYLHLCNSTDDDVSKFLEQCENSGTLRTQYLDLGIYHGDEVSMILQHLDANCLKNIRFFSTSYFDKNIDFNEIVKLDQWKNANEFSSRNLSIDASMKHFTHFSKINAEFRRILSEPEDLNVLKEAAIRSPKFEKFSIEYHISFNSHYSLEYLEIILAELFGNPFPNARLKRYSWFFNTCGGMKILKIDHFLSFNRINFSLIDRSMVPNGAEVKNLL